MHYAVYCKRSKIGLWEGLGTRLARPYLGRVFGNARLALFTVPHTAHTYFLCMGGNDIHRERIFSSDVTNKYMCA